MLKRVQHDKKKHVIPSLFRNLEFWNDNKLIAFGLSTSILIKAPPRDLRFQSSKPSGVTLIDRLALCRLDI
jgi:hypothetical protein